MTEQTFRELVDAAIEERRSLDTPAFGRLSEAASEDDRLYWQSQMRLDRAVGQWRAKQPIPAVRTFAVAATVLSLRTSRGMRSVRTVTALALGLSVIAVWSGRQTAPPEPLSGIVPTESVLTIASESVGRETVGTGHPETVNGHGPDGEDLASGDAGERDGFAEATETAERLAYAFQPVGEHVGSVVRLLIGAVPGADVFSM